MTNSPSLLTKLTCGCIVVCLMNNMQYVGGGGRLALVYKVSLAVMGADRYGAGEKTSLCGRTTACAGPQIIASKGVGR